MLMDGEQDQRQQVSRTNISTTRARPSGSWSRQDGLERGDTFRRKTLSTRSVRAFPAGLRRSPKPSAFMNRRSRPVPGLVEAVPVFEGLFREDPEVWQDQASELERRHRGRGDHPAILDGGLIQVAGPGPESSGGPEARSLERRRSLIASHPVEDRLLAERAAQSRRPDVGPKRDRLRDRRSPPRGRPDSVTLMAASDRRPARRPLAL
jgi:hypothetical protein